MKRLNGIMVGVLAVGFAAHTDAAELGGSCEVEFAVHVSMGDSFVGKVTTEPFTVKEGEATKVDVQISKMDTGKKGKTKDMAKLLREDLDPLIHATVDPAAALALGPDSTNDLPFQLTIAGVTNAMKAVLSNFKEADDQRSFDAAFPVSVKAFGMKAPSMMLGLIKVGDEVKVTARVTLDSKPAAKP